VKKAWDSGFLVPLLLILLFFLPSLVLVMQSFSGRWLSGELLPQGWTLDWWSHLLGRPGVGQALVSSLGYSLLVVLVSGLLCWPAARVLAWNPPSHKAFWEAFLLAPAIMPPLITVFGIHRAFSWLGLGDNVLAVVLVLSFYAYPYLLRTLQAAYENTDPRLLEVARPLGAGPWHIFWTLEFPLMLPAFFQGASVVFLVAFSDYLVVSLLGGGLVPAFSALLVPALSSANRTWASVLTLVFVLLPLGAFLFLEGRLAQVRRRRGAGA